MRLNQVKKYLASSSKSYHRGFSLIDNLRSDDLNLEVTRLFHEKSGAMIYNVKSNDNDNTFAPIVRTLPQNNTGCPHILQHLACCGSERFPIRDPFFNMLRRSVSTYMNAWTGDDFTAYPFSSANSKDFGNLYKVYLDMCLRPMLNELDFRQEGWRYEINAETGQKQLKGIVFNEMKGAYQNPDRQLYVEVANKLFSSTPFGYDSGGKPDSIVKLSYEEVKNMHKYYYHPSNMSFYYYGNSDIKNSISFLQEQYLHKFDFQNKTIDYNKKSDLLMSKMPQNLEKTFYTVYSSTSQTPNISLTYNIGTLSEVNGIDISCLNMLAYLLLQTNQAIFYQQFIQSQLADSFSMAGLNVGSVLSFGFTLKNASISGEEVLKRVQRILGQLIQNGVDSKRLEEYLIQAQLDILTPKSTQGIAYLGGYLPFMANRLPLTNLIKIRSNLQQAVKKLKNKQQLSKLINSCFLSNKKKIVITQQPNKQKADDFNNLKGLQIPQNIIKTQQTQLKQRQQSLASNSVDCLPKLYLSDLSPAERSNYQIVSQGFTSTNHSVKQISVKIDKKDINFIRLVFTIDCQREEHKKLINFLDIWRYAIRKGIAVKGMTNKQVSSKINSCCNDFKVKLEKGGPDRDPTSINIVFTASCLNETVPEYVQILRKIIYQPQFNNEDFNNIFRNYKSEKVEELLDGGVMQYCLDYGSSFISQQGKIFNTYNLVTQGIKIAEKGEVPQQFNLIHIALQKEANITLIQHSSQYRDNLLDKIGINYTKSSQNVIQPKKIKAENVNHLTPSISVTNAYDVNFCSQQYPGPKFLSKEQAHLTLLVEVLQQDYLHPKIRQKGGAYGARAVVRESGTIALYSYMDPYSTETYTAFEQSIKQLLKSKITNDRLEQVKIKVLGAFDGPIVPQNECYQEILKNYSTNQRNQYRKFIKQAEWKQIIESGQKYLGGSVKSKVMFGKDVPKQFTQEKLKIPKQSISQQQAQQAASSVGKH